MPYDLSPISYGSIIVGFTGFTFTVLTFVRVFWEIILTLWSAPEEMKSFLDNLRSELQGERAYFKSMLRRQRSRSGRWRSVHDDLSVIVLLNDTVKDLMHQLKTLEQPFLTESADQKEKDVERSKDSILGEYAPMTLRRRWHWMQTKDEIKAMAIQVNRIQTRRIACDTSNALL